MFCFAEADYVVWEKEQGGGVVCTKNRTINHLFIFAFLVHTRYHWVVRYSIFGDGAKLF